MIDYRKLRTKLDNSPPDQWDQIVEDAIEIYESKVNELPGEVMGSAVSDVEVEDAFETLAQDAEDYRMDLRLRAAMESYAKGDRGVTEKTVMGRLRKRAKKRRIAR